MRRELSRQLCCPRWVAHGATGGDMEFFDIARSAGQRWQERQAVREPRRAKIREGKAIEVETPERVQLRLERLSKIATEASNVNAAAPPGGAGSLVELIGRERILGDSDFLDINFLEVALAVSRFVGRINIRSAHGRTLGYGTGFMVSPCLLMTNNHVLDSAEQAATSEVEFDFQNDRFGRLLPVVGFGLDPQTFFMTNKELDFSLVAVRSQSVRGTPLKHYGWCRLIGSQGKALLGESLNIIQHPRGQAKQLVLRSNELIDLFEHYAHYVTDTEPGSSGSPVYNDQWELVTLHHSGVPRKDAQGNYLARDGTVWREGMDPDALDWVANEGIRVSSLVAHIKAQALAPAQARLREELLNLEPPTALEAAQAMRASEQPGAAQAVAAGQGVLTQTLLLPLTVQVQMGVVGVQSPAAQPALPAAAATAPAGLSVALAELERSRTRVYYDEEADAADRAAYYGNLELPASAAAAFAALHALLFDTHGTRLSYSPSRNVYPWVDLHEGGAQPQLCSIYSGKAFDAREFIESDFEIETRRARLRESMRQSGALGSESTQVTDDFLEASLPFNCEHVVPQSWFGKKEPMRGDLHHLFTCETGCTSFRGNIPYFDFADFEEVVRSACGKRETGKFEPEAGKGAVARATLYFLLRYPGEINRSAREYTPDRIVVLLAWHQAFAVTAYERHRNAAIFEKQGNRNPLIDFPEWADRIAFERGLGD